MTRAETIERIADLKERANDAQEVIYNAAEMRNANGLGRIIQDQEDTYREINRLRATL